MHSNRDGDMEHGGGRGRGPWLVAGLGTAAIAAAAALCGTWANQATGHVWRGTILAGVVAGSAAAVLVRLALARPAHGNRTGLPPGLPAQDQPALPPGRLERLAELEAQTASLRHDLRGILAPAMLVGDRLTENPDPKVAKAGETVVRAVNRASDRLAQTKGTPVPQAGEATPPDRR